MLLVITFGRFKAARGLRVRLASAEGGQRSKGGSVLAHASFRYGK